MLLDSSQVPDTHVLHDIHGKDAHLFLHMCILINCIGVNSLEIIIILLIDPYTGDLIDPFIDDSRCDRTVDLHQKSKETAVGISPEFQDPAYCLILPLCLLNVIHSLQKLCYCLVMKCQHFRYVFFFYRNDHGFGIHFAETIGTLSEALKLISFHRHEPMGIEYIIPLVPALDDLYPVRDLLLPYLQQIFRDAGEFCPVRNIPLHYLRPVCVIPVSHRRKPFIHRTIQGPVQAIGIKLTVSVAQYHHRAQITYDLMTIVQLFQISFAPFDIRLNPFNSFHFFHVLYSEIPV